MPLLRASNRPLLALLTFPLLAAACGGEGASSTGSGGAPGSGGSGGEVGSQGGATSTAGGSCQPGETGPCYGGPVGTQGVGLCKDGVRTCQPDGTFGACVGEVTPALERCSTPEDDNCNGQVNESGTDCVCVPGAMSACYSGPADTVGVGVCKMGVQTCAPDGLGPGPCEGEIAPAAEDCLAPADEDCNGDAPTCTGNQLWAKRYGDVMAQTASGVAASGGGAVITGSFAGATNFGGGVLTSAGATDVFLARIDAGGLPLWSKSFGDVAAQTASRVAVDGQGNIAVIGNFEGKIDFGGGALTSAGATDVFVAKFDPTGTLLWSKSFGDVTVQSGLAIAFAPNGDMVFTGSFNGSINLGGGALTSAGATDLFVARLDSAGTYLWGQRFGDVVAQVGKGIAVDGQGNVIVTGDIAGTVDFGGGVLTSAGATDVLLLVLDPTGAHVSSKLFGNIAIQTASGVAVDAVGNLLLAGSGAGSMDFGGGALTSAGSNDIFVAKLTAGGVHLWSKRYGAAGNQDARDIAVDPSGAVLVAGDFTTSVDFGGGVLTSAGLTDGFLAKLDSSGGHVWSKKQGNAVAQSVTGVAADGSGVFATGTFAGTVTFGGATLTSAGATDVMVAKLLP